MANRVAFSPFVCWNGREIVSFVTFSSCKSMLRSCRCDSTQCIYIRSDTIIRDRIILKRWRFTLWSSLWSYNSYRGWMKLKRDWKKKNSHFRTSGNLSFNHWVVRWWGLQLLASIQVVTSYGNWRLAKEDLVPMTHLISWLNNLVRSSWFHGWIIILETLTRWPAWCFFFVRRGQVDGSLPFSIMGSNV